MIIVWADCSEATHMLISHPISSQTELRSLLFAHPSIAVSHQTNEPDCLSGLNGDLEGFRAWADVKMDKHDQMDVICTQDQKKSDSIFNYEMYIFLIKKYTLYNEQDPVF